MVCAAFFVYYPLVFSLLPCYISAGGSSDDGRWFLSPPPPTILLCGASHELDSKLSGPTLNFEKLSKSAASFQRGSCAAFSSSCAAFSSCRCRVRHLSVPHPFSSSWRVLSPCLCVIPLPCHCSAVRSEHARTQQVRPRILDPCGERGAPKGRLPTPAASRRDRYRGEGLTVSLLSLPFSLNTVIHLWRYCNNPPNENHWSAMQWLR